MGIFPLGLTSSGVGSPAAVQINRPLSSRGRVFIRTTGGQRYHAEQVEPEEHDSTDCRSAIRHCWQGFCRAVRGCFKSSTHRDDECAESNQHHQMSPPKEECVDWQSIRMRSHALAETMEQARAERATAMPQLLASEMALHELGSRTSSLSAVSRELEVVEFEGDVSCLTAAAQRLRRWWQSIRSFFASATSCCRGFGATEAFAKDGQSPQLGNNLRGRLEISAPVVISAPVIPAHSIFIQVDGFSSIGSASSLGSTSSASTGNHAGSQRDDQLSDCSIERAGKYGNEYLWQGFKSAGS